VHAVRIDPDVGAPIHAMLRGGQVEM
jgi:hypothetical protein